MGYTTVEHMVRVDFFKPSGEWYTTEAVEWTGYFDWIHLEFKTSLRNHLKDDKERLSGMTAVCLEPYNENSHPLMIKVDDIWS